MLNILTEYIESVLKKRVFTQIIMHPRHGESLVFRQISKMSMHDFN